MKAIYYHGLDAADQEIAKYLVEMNWKYPPPSFWTGVLRRLERATSEFGPSNFLLQGLEDATRGANVAVAVLELRAGLK